MRDRDCWGGSHNGLPQYRGTQKVLQWQDISLSSKEDALEIFGDPRPSKLPKIGFLLIRKVMLLPQPNTNMDELHINLSVMKWNSRLKTSISVRLLNLFVAGPSSTFSMCRVSQRSIRS